MTAPLSGWTLEGSCIKKNHTVGLFLFSQIPEKKNGNNLHFLINT